MHVLPPSVMRLRLAGRDSRRVALWIPLFILWPVGLTLLIIAVPFLAIAQMTVGWRGIRPLSMTIGVVQAIHELRGLSVDIATPSRGESVLVTFS